MELIGECTIEYHPFFFKWERLFGDENKYAETKEPLGAAAFVQVDVLHGFIFAANIPGIIEILHWVIDSVDLCRLPQSP